MLSVRASAERGGKPTERTPLVFQTSLKNPFSTQSSLLTRFQKDTYLRKSPGVMPSLRS
jgi:hypothetical protein